MSIGGSQRVMLRFRVLFPAFILPVMVAVGVLWLGQSGARATQLLVHQPLTLHGGPGTAFSVLATLASGTKVDVLWCNAEATWCLVEDGAVEGWAPRAELITRDASSTQPPTGRVPPSDATASNVTGTDGPTASIVESTASANAGGINGGAALAPGGSRTGVSLGLSVKQN